MTIVITTQSQQREVEMQEKAKWVRNILGHMGMPVEEWTENLSMQDLRRLRVELKSLDIDIIDDTDNGLEIYYQGNLIAEWRRPFYVLKEDRNQLNPKDRYYLEMHLRCNDAFDETP